MARELGISSFKFYMAYTQDEASVFGINAMNDKQIIDGLRNIKAIGYPAMMMVHAENMSIIHGLKAKYIAEGRNDLKAWTDARPDIAEEEATRRAIWYARETGSRLYIVHMTIGRGVEWVRQAQAEGVDVIAETCPHYLVLTKFDQERVGHLGKVNPPLRDEWNQERLWEGIRDGTVSCVGSDHSTIVQKADKLQKDIWTAVPGFPGAGMLLPIMLRRAITRAARRSSRWPPCSRPERAGLGPLPKEGRDRGRLGRRLRDRRSRGAARGHARVHALVRGLGPLRRLGAHWLADDDDRPWDGRVRERQGRRRGGIRRVRPEASAARPASGRPSAAPLLRRPTPAA